MNRKSHHLLAIALLMVVFGACRGTRSVTLDTMRPAEITFPSYVDNIVIADRTKFDKEAVNVVESILTGEMPGEDATGVQELINAFQQQLSYSPRFQTRVASERLTGNSLTSVFPKRLSWRTVNQLCKKYDAQAVVAIEIFDTDFIITDGKRVVKKTVTVDSVQREVEVNEFYAKGVGNINIGIRLYDPKAKKVIDQQLLKQNRTWNAEGASLRDALAKLAAKSEATRYLSQRVGGSYAHKIAPMPIQISRSFVGKSRKAPALEQGTRYADVGEWKNAISVWKQGIKRAPPTKQCGYLSQNIAIAYEVLGDLKTARKWAQKSYVRYGNKDAKRYVSLIQQRLYDEQLAERQMK